jgi:hypothetical protein
MDYVMSDVKLVIASLQEVLVKLKPNTLEYYELETQIVYLKLLFCKVRNDYIKLSSDSKTKE